MSVIRFILVWSACLAIGSSNAWCMCCALLCQQTPAIATTEQMPATSCCGKQMVADDSSGTTPVCPTGQQQCEKCDQTVSADSPKIAAKPAVADAFLISPFLAGEAFPPGLQPAANGFTPPAVAQCEDTSSGTLLDLQCALNL